MSSQQSTATIRIPQTDWEIEAYRQLITSKLGRSVTEAARIDTYLGDYLGEGRYKLHCTQRQEPFDFGAMLDVPLVSGWVALVETDHTGPMIVDLAWQFDGHEPYGEGGGTDPSLEAATIFAVVRHG